MRMLLAALLTSLAGAAAAGETPEPRVYESNDYAGQVYYRMEFGGARQGAQSVGLRFGPERAAARGRPALLDASFGAQGLGKVALNGVDLRGLAVSSQATEGGGLTVGQWVGIGFTALVFVAIAVEAADSDDEVSGTGGY